MGKLGPRECVVFNGRKYGRYPQSAKRSHRDYFAAGFGQTLHRDVWKSGHGDIPPGMDVHHMDENPLNNDLSNLELIDHGEHRRRHMGPENIEKLRKNIQRAQAVAPLWHKSEAGQAWHRQHGESCRGPRKRQIKAVCEWCNQGFDAALKRARFCSRSCLRKSRSEREKRRRL